MSRAELLVDEHAGGVGVDAALDRDLHALVDQLLGVADRLGLLRGGIALDPEHLLLEGAPVVEGEDVELSVIAEGHWGSTFVVTWRGGQQATLPRREAELHRPELHAGHRGGADDRRPRVAGTSRTRSRTCWPTAARERRRRPRRHQARAPRVGARDRHQAVRGHPRGGRRAARPAPPGRRDRRPRATSRSARPARTRSRAGRTSGSPPARATAT